MWPAMTSRPTSHRPYLRGTVLATSKVPGTLVTLASYIQSMFMYSVVTWPIMYAVRQGKDDGEMVLVLLVVPW